MQQRTRNFPCRRNPPSELSEADAADHPSVSNVVHIAKHADTRFCICRGIMTSPVRHRRIFKCCIIISYFPEKSKRSARFFQIFSVYGKNRSAPAVIFDSRNKTRRLRQQEPPHFSGLSGGGDQACSGAPTGHASAQAPQSRQVSASITYLPSPSEIAPAGQASAQAPHWMQASLIAYAITVTSCRFIIM